MQTRAFNFTPLLLLLLFCIDYSYYSTVNRYYCDLGLVIFALAPRYYYYYICIIMIILY